jgi:CRISPR-associated endonuclease/helicase Cas3
LDEHLRETAKLAREFASSFGSKEHSALASEIAYLLTLWHDLGKYHPDFQAYLKECHRLYLAGERQQQRGPDHKAAGTYLASIHLSNHLPLIIQGHHGGLPSYVEFVNWLHDKENNDWDRIETCLLQAEAEIPDLEPMIDVQLPHFLASFDPQYPDSSPIESIYSFEFFIRMIYSCLVDADSLDTERHTNHQQSEQRYKRNLLSEQHWQAFEQYHAKLEKQASASVNDVQDEVYQACLATADERPGFFRLTVPTGGGKTLSGLAFALRHALHPKHQLERVIIAVPYLTITQQTTRVYREIFADLQVNEGQPVVLEHYSSADAFREEADRDKNVDQAEQFDPHKVWQRLAAENWDAPIIVTTTVQLFESMFARKRSRSRKLHNLAKSIIILDETQALPAQLLTPILSGLRELVDHYGSTVVFCTATQPEFNLIRGFRSRSVEATTIGDREIVENYADHFAALKRVDYDWRTNVPCEWSDVADWMLVQPQRQALAIVNTKKDAHALLATLEEALSKEGSKDTYLFHLSTLLCGKHRDHVLEQITERLAQSKPCLLVSTQVVEAGVDFDFPLVLRALGPLDSIVQAAGRCNRKGKLNEIGQLGKLIIFDPREGGEPLGVPTLGRQVTETLQRRGNLDPNDPANFADYYTRLFTLIDPDSEKIQEVRQSFEYREAAHRFRMIKDDTIALVVEYSSAHGKERKDELEKVRTWLQNLIDRRGKARELLRLLQPYTINMRRWQALKLQGRLHKGKPAVELIGDETSNIGVWNGDYDDVRGVILPEGLGLDELVV